MQCKLFFQVSLQVLILKGEEKKKDLTHVSKVLKLNLNALLELKQTVLVKKAWFRFK